MAEIDLSTARGQLLNLLRVFDPDPNDGYLQYAELARRCRSRLWGGPVGQPDVPWVPPGQGKPPGKPPPPVDITAADQVAALRAAVGFFGPEPDDARKGDQALLERLAVLLDVMVGRWTSRVVQPVGPTGDMSTTRQGI